MGNYPYKTSPTGRYVLEHDERGEIMRGTEAECWKHLHGAVGYSIEHAIRHEGWSMRPEPAKRIMRFGLASDFRTIVSVHPQAERPLDKPGHVGTVLARIEPWISSKGAAAIVAALNTAQIAALDLEEA